MRTEHITATQARSLFKHSPRRNKHNAVKTIVDGVTFDSKGEAAWFARLQLRERAGEISNLQRQVPFVITPKWTSKDGRKHRDVKLVVDATWTEDGMHVIADFKGFQTRDWVNKWKALEYAKKDENVRFVVARKEDL
jgi:hypothetical protein